MRIFNVYANDHTLSIALALVMCFAVLGPAAGQPSDDEPTAAKGHPIHDSTQADVTDPSVILTQTQFIYWTGRDSGAEGDSETFLFQPVIPLSKKNVLRPALPFLATAEPDRVTGIGDLFVLDLWITNLAHSSWGIGPAGSLPIATEDGLGTGKFSLGPAALYMWKGVPRNLFGIIGYNQTSVAGDSDRADVNVLSLQPIWVLHFKWGYMGWTDLLMTFDWENDGSYTIPLGLRFGKVLKGKTPYNLAIQPYYEIRDDAPNGWGVKLMAAVVYPNLFTH